MHNVLKFWKKLMSVFKITSVREYFAKLLSQKFTQKTLLKYELFAHVGYKFDENIKYATCSRKPW